MSTNPPYRTLDALGDPTRRAVFELLRTRAYAVGELAAQLPVTRPAVSQHLRVLKDAGLVTERQEGTRRIYRVDPSGLVALRTYLESFWSDVLEAFKADAESTGEHNTWQHKRRQSRSANRSSSRARRSTRGKSSRDE